MVVARSRDQLDELAASLRDACLALAVDLHEPEAPAAVVAATIAHFGRLDLLVNNAGATKRGDFLTLSEPDWADGFGLKFFGAVRCCRAAWPHLQTTSRRHRQHRRHRRSNRDRRSSPLAARSTRRC